MAEARLQKIWINLHDLDAPLGKANACKIRMHGKAMLTVDLVSGRLVTVDQIWTVTDAMRGTQLRLPDDDPMWAIIAAAIPYSALREFDDALSDARADSVNDLVLLLSQGAI